MRVRISHIARLCLALAWASPAMAANPKALTAHSAQQPIMTQMAQNDDHCGGVAIRKAFDVQIAPDLHGCVYGQVVPLVEELYGTKPTRQDRSDSSARETIFDQTPHANEKLARGDPLELTVSTGPADTTPGTATTTNTTDNSNGTKPSPDNKGGTAHQADFVPTTQAPPQQRSWWTKRRIEIAVIAAIMAAIAVAALATFLRRPPLHRPLPGLRCDFEHGPGKLAVEGPLVMVPHLEIGVEFESRPPDNIAIKILGRT